jgi:hypothetical protein
MEIATTPQGYMGLFGDTTIEVPGGTGISKKTTAFAHPYSLVASVNQALGGTNTVGVGLKPDTSDPTLARLYFFAYNGYVSNTFEINLSLTYKQ